VRFWNNIDLVKTNVKRDKEKWGKNRKCGSDGYALKDDLVMFMGKHQRRTINQSVYNTNTFGHINHGKRKYETS